MKYEQIEKYFSAEAVATKSMLIGRDSYLSSLINLIKMKGYHVVISGERGVGKSSLVKTAGNELKKENYFKDGLAIDYKCTGKEDYLLLKNKLLSNIGIYDEKNISSPDDVVKKLVETKVSGYIIIDEFEQCNSEQKIIISQFLKHLGEAGAPITLCFCEAVDVPKELYKAHKSSKRYLERIKLLGLDPSATGIIVSDALKAAGFHELLPQYEIAIHGVTLGVPYRVKELARFILDSVRESESGRVTGETLKRSYRTLLKNRYEEEWALIDYFSKLQIEKDLCFVILRESSQCSFFDFIDYKGIFRKLSIEYGDSVVTKINYEDALKRLLHKYKIFSSKKNIYGEDQIYFTDHSYPFVERSRYAAS